MKKQQPVINHDELNRDELEDAEPPVAVVKTPAPEVTVSRVKTYKTTATAAPRVLVVSCGDPRFQGPIRQFLESELGYKEGEYLPFVIRGGVASFTVVNFFPKEARYVTDGAVTYVKQFSSIDRVILVNHEDCGKYKVLHSVAPFLFAGLRNIVDRQRLDLHEIGDKLVRIFPRPLVIDKYFAKFANSSHTEVVFEKL